MNKTILLAALIVFSGFALAEPPDGKGRGRMLDALDLSEEQKEQIAEIRESGGGKSEIHAVLTEEQRARLAELRAERGKKYGKQGNKPGKRLGHLKRELDLSDEQASQIGDIFEAGGSREEVRAVLTQEQQEKFDQMRERKGKGKGYGKGQGHGKGQGKDAGDDAASE